ncbi:PIN domain-containing protein [Salinarimonas ramus]|uniref:Twitching motility protein PilT n=1 Tax=Salinarimonas ramus TaxID=690164 RepID=A0A917V2F9_9HYPH|nr:PIN domain-containing protein [Salinarimonas ramus]GGK22723.1 twitching motility protein PilT [Salinarimonas ramus]
MKAFFDTNILVYAQREGRKGDTARSLMLSGGSISVQVLNELSNVLRRKRGLDWDEIIDIVEDVMKMLGDPLPITLETHRLGVMLARANGFSFYDSLLLAAAIQDGCDVMYSEDMQHGRVLGTLEIRNPFV